MYIGKIKFTDIVTSISLFLINVFSDTEYFPSVLETVGIPVPTWNIVTLPNRLRHSLGG
jgi:hypothetical protein